jgi:hypothetical protein
MSFYSSRHVYSLSDSRSPLLLLLIRSLCFLLLFSFRYSFLYFSVLFSIHSLHAPFLLSTLLYSVLFSLFSLLCSTHFSLLSLLSLLSTLLYSLTVGCGTGEGVCGGCGLCRLRVRRLLERTASGKGISTVHIHRIISYHIIQSLTFPVVLLFLFYYFSSTVALTLYITHHHAAFPSISLTITIPYHDPLSLMLSA